MATLQTINSAVYRGVYDDQVSAGAAAATRALKANSQAVKENADAVRAQTAEVKAAGPSIDALNRKFFEQDRLAQATARANREYEKSIAALRAAYQQTGGDAAKLAEAERRAGVLRDQQIAKARAAAEAMRQVYATPNASQTVASASAMTRGMEMASASATKAAASFGLARHQVQNLTAQVVDFTVQVSSGQGFLMPMIQQGPQAVDAIGGVGAALRMLASPAGVAAVAIAAVVGAGIMLMARLSDLRQEARSFEVALVASNAAIGTSVGQLQEYTRALERQGIEREKARAAILEIARTPNISGQTRQDIASLLPDFAAGRGVELNDALKQLIDLATGGREAVFKLQDQIGFMSIAQQESAQRFYEQGRSAEALRVVFDALQDRFRGLREQELGPQARAWNELRNSWTQFLDSVANSRPVIAAVELMTAALNRLAGIRPPADLTALMDGVNQEIEQTQARLERLRTAMSRMAPSVRSSADTVIPGEVGPGSPLDKERQLMEQLAELDARRLALMERQRASAEGTEGSLRRQANITPNAPTAAGAPAAPNAEQAEIDRQAGIVSRVRTEVDALAAAHRRGGNAVAEYRARTSALAEAQRLNLNAGNTAILVEQRLREARLGGANASGADRIRERTQELARETEAGVRLNEAITQGLPGLLRAQAETQALADVDGRRTANLQAQTQAILDRNAAQEASKGAETVVNLQQEIAAAERLANAAGISAQAEAAATLENNIEQATARMRAYAQVTTDPRIAAALTAQADKIDEQKRQLSQLNELARNRRAIVAAEMQSEYTQRELDLVGATVVERDRELAILREQQNIRREGGVLTTDEARRRVELAAQNVEDNAALTRKRELYQELGNFGSQAFDRIGEAITQSFVTGERASVSFRNVAKAVLSEIIQLALRLSVINPMANWVAGTNRPTIFDAGRSGAASAAGAAAGGASGTVGTASGATSGATLLSGFPRYADGVVTSGAGAIYAPGYQASTGVTMIDSVANYNVVGGVSALQAGAGVASIAGGAYGVYSGLQTGGASGYTQAAGGAVGVAGGVAGLAVASGATSAGGILAGSALGTAAAATAAWAPYVAAALIIASMLMPGPKQSNAAAGANINLSTGVVNLENSGKETDATAGARDQMVKLVSDTTSQLGKLLGVTASGVIGFELGQRDPSRVVLNGQQVGTAGVGDSQKLADILGKAILQSFAQAPGLQDVQKRILDAAGGNVDFAMNLLAQTKSLVDTFGSDALNPDRNPATRAIYDAAVQTGNIEAVVAALKGAAELTAAYGDALSSADALQVISKGGGNIQKIATDLQWLFEVYRPLTGAAEQISALDQAIAASNRTYQSAIARATELGLATDVLAQKQAEAAEKIRQSLRDSYDALMAEAQGMAPVTQAVGTAKAIRANWDANALDYLAVGRDPNALYAAQMTAAFKDLDIATLERVVEELKGLDEVAVLFAQAALDAAKATEEANKAAARAATAKSFDAQLREATGGGWVNQIIELSDTIAANAEAYRDAGKDPALLYAAQVKQIIDGLDADALATAAQYLQGLDGVAADFLSAAIQAAQAAQQMAAAAQIAADAADYDAKMRQAMGLDLVNTIVAIGNEIDKMAARYSAAGKDPAALYTAQVNAALKGQDQATLAKTAAALQGLDASAASLATTALEQTIAANVAAAQQEVAAAAAEAAAQAQRDAAAAAEQAARDAEQAQRDAASAAEAAAREQEQAAQEAQRAAEQLVQAGQGIRDYINRLRSSPEAGFTPTQALANAQATYNTDLALAQGGNLDALGRITGSADALIEAAKAMYASGPQFVAIRDQIIAQLTALPAVQSADQQIIDQLAGVNSKLTTTNSSIGTTNSSLGTANSSLSGISSSSGSTSTKLTEANAYLARIDTNNDGVVSIDEIKAAAQANIATAQQALTTAAQNTATNAAATKTSVDASKTAIDLGTAKTAEVKGEVTSSNEISVQIQGLNATLTAAATSSTGGFVALGTLLSNLTRYAAAGAFNTMYSRPASTDPGIAISSALGNAFEGGALVTSPTTVPLSLMGEAGPEAVMPLQRGPGGRLGVAMWGGAANDNRTLDRVVAAIREAQREHTRAMAGMIRMMIAEQRNTTAAVEDLRGTVKKRPAA